MSAETSRTQVLVGVWFSVWLPNLLFMHIPLVFREAGNFNKAILAYEKSLDWQDLFDLAVQQTTSEEELSDIGYRVAEELTSKKRYQEAARVYLDYAKDVRSATIALVQGNQFSEARRLVSTLLLTPYMNTRFIEVFSDHFTSTARAVRRCCISRCFWESVPNCRRHQWDERPVEETTPENTGASCQEGRRTGWALDLDSFTWNQSLKLDAVDAFYGVEDTDLHNVDVMTDISMAPTMFTRYTVAPSAASRSSKFVPFF